MNCIVGTMTLMIFALTNHLFSPDLFKIWYQTYLFAIVNVSVCVGDQFNLHWETYFFALTIFLNCKSNLNEMVVAFIFTSEFSYLHWKIYLFSPRDYFICTHKFIYHLLPLSSKLALYRICNGITNLLSFALKVFDICC